MATFSHDAATSSAVVADSSDVTRRPTATNARTIQAAGSSRRARRDQNWRSEKRRVARTSWMITVPMTTPDSVKKSETPR